MVRLVRYVLDNFAAQTTGRDQNPSWLGYIGDYAHAVIGIISYAMK